MKFYKNLKYFFLSILVVNSAMIFAENPKFNNEGNMAMQRTLEFAKGHQSFKDVVFKNHEKEFVRLVQEGQSPKVLFIGCSDSRVIPELISSFSPGELFVIRTAGNFVPTYDQNISWDGVAATIQYAVEVLGVKDIIVCGHSHCGAIEGLYNPKLEDTLGLVSKWLKFGEAAKKMAMQTVDPSASKENIYLVTGHISVIYQLEHLLTYSFIKKLVDEQKIFLHGWFFTIETGQITYYDANNFEFLPLTSLLEKNPEKT